MAFRLFGVNVDIQMGFWINALLLGLMGGGLDDPKRLAVWVPIVLISVLAHEYGHAFAIARRGIEPEITLHWMGGTTSWRNVLPLSRPYRVFISLAGPLTNILIAALALGFARLLPGAYHRMPALAQDALHTAISANLFWGVFNLLPVLPLDGGHVLEHALGPKRLRLTIMISLGFAVLGAIFFMSRGMFIAAMLFALSALQSFQRLRSDDTVDGLPEGRQAPPRERPPPPEIGLKIRAARKAIAEDDLGLAASLANEAVKMIGEHDEPLPRAKVEAYEVLGWVAQLRGETSEATRWVKAAQQHGPPDAALVAAVLIGRGDTRDARKILEGARAAGDDRKEIVGPLIQILIAEGEVARAGAVAFDIVESLSDEDARRMAEISFSARAYEWAARLYEAVFARTKSPEDAYDAARALTADGALERALDLLGRAVDAGFSDRARAWSDAALEPLRAGQRLEAVVPRP